MSENLSIPPDAHARMAMLRKLKAQHAAESAKDDSKSKEGSHNVRCVCMLPAPESQPLDAAEGTDVSVD